ncbi:hypothetical protein Dda_8041 [Drechslerella dactyloides]|uniref:BHLH domain-containing protein n=1 Tax=Drechslerella dactyloides TaxID=74499 RepID=A0AAD6NG60_DREDA|nr:hypothetical protein Dda_8041 [Drechslerella dactyloides]
MAFQQETSSASFMLPPCKDIIREATAGAICDVFDGQEPKEAAAVSTVKSPNQTYRAQEQPRGEYSRPHSSSYSQSLSNSSSSPVSTISPKLSSFLRFAPKRRDCASNQYHPYRKESCSYLSSHGHGALPLPALKTNFEQRSAAVAPRSPPNTRKSSFAASDSSSSFGRTGFIFGEEDLVSTPLTPLTQHSEEAQTTKEESFDTSLVQRYQQTQESLKNTKQSTELAKAARRRKAHLQSEQRRREHIKDGMDRLVQVVPACQESRDTKGISKAAILKHAYEYIYQLRTDLQNLKQLNMNKDREIAELRRRLALSNPGLPTHWR